MEVIITGWVEHAAGEHSSKFERAGKVKLWTGKIELGSKSLMRAAIIQVCEWKRMCTARRMAETLLDEQLGLGQFCCG